MGKQTSIPLQFGGMLSAGDAASLPDGKTRLLQDALIRPLRQAKRPPFTYDSLMAISGLANHEDITNKVSRLVALDTSHHPYRKGTSGEAWSGSLGTISGSRVTSSANYRGVLYVMIDDGSGLPSVAVSFDGANLSTSPFNSALVARAVVTLDERLYLIYPRLTITNKLLNAVNVAYNWTMAGCAKTNVNAVNITTSGEIICRLFPLSTAANACYANWTNSFAAFVADGIGILDGQALSVDTVYIYQFTCKPVDPSYRLPVTLLVTLTGTQVTATPYPFALGDLLVRGAYTYRCTVAGSANGAEPAWTANGGATSVWNTATFTNIGPSLVASYEVDIPNATEQQTPITFDIPFVVPWGNGSSATVRLNFYNTNTPALTTLAPLDVSLRDGLADGDIRKRNYGQQITIGDFEYPFFNQETTAIATIDEPTIINSDVGLPKVIRGQSTYNLTSVPGDPTAACKIDKRLIVWKRKAFWILQETGQDDIVLRLERTINAVGCLGPLAHDEHNDETFFIAEDDVYRFKVGHESPTPICGDMREEIMSHDSAAWVEAQSTYKRPLLCIDKLRLLLYVYTQKSKLYVYDLRTQQWATWATPNGAEIDAMLWNQNTGNVYMAFGGAGLARVDYSSVAKDTIASGGTDYAVDQVTVFRPIESDSVPRQDLRFKTLHLFYAASADQTGQTFKVEYSYDQGATYNNYVQGTLAQTAASKFAHLFLDVAREGPSLTIRTTHSGKGGEGSFALAPHGYVDVEESRVEYNRAPALTITASEL